MDVYDKLSKEWDTRKSRITSVDLPYHRIIDINNILVFLYQYISKTDMLWDNVCILIDTIIQIFDATYYVIDASTVVYYIPYLLSMVTDNNQIQMVSRRLFIPQFKHGSHLDMPFMMKTKKEKEVRANSNAPIHYTSQEVRNYIDVIIHSKGIPLISSLSTLNNMAMANETGGYIVWRAVDNLPKSHYYFNLYKSAFIPNTKLFSSPDMDLKKIVSLGGYVFYINIGMDTNNIEYPDVKGLGLPKLLNKIHFMSGIVEPNKSDIASYFSSVSPLYSMIDMDTSSGDHLLNLCDLIVSLNTSNNQYPVALKYFKGMWGMGTTFAVVPDGNSWRNARSSSNADNLADQFGLFVDNVALLLAECLMLLWHTKPTFGHIIQGMSTINGHNHGLRRLNYVDKQIRDDMLNDRVGKKDYNTIEESIRSIKILILEIGISDKCEMFTEICLPSKKELNDDIKRVLKEETPTMCYNNLVKSSYTDMFRKYINEVTSDKYCLQYFNFKSRLFPLFYVHNNVLVMLLPQYATNEWILPFNIDTLFQQYIDSNNVCYTVADSRFVSNKLDRIMHISYDESPNGLKSQCTCNKKFLAANNVNIEQFMVGFLKGYIAMVKAKSDLIRNGLFYTTFDVICDQNHRLTLLDVNNGGNYGTELPSKFLFTMNNMLSKNPGLFESLNNYELYTRSIPGSDMRMCSDLDKVYIVKTVI
jgi:hypothetical protein